jgi:hypothetical protein
MVVVQWTLVEEFVKIYIYSFTDENDADDPIRKQFDATRSMETRLDMWEELTKQQIQPAWQKPMLELVRDTRQLADSRNKIVHGVWGGKDNAKTEDLTQAHGPASFGKPGTPFSWKLDYGGILAVALKVDNHHKAMTQFIFKTLGSNPPSGFRFGSALRRIQT